MITQIDAIEHLARVKFQLYSTYGIGDFHNHLSNETNRIERQEVLNALTYDSVRKLAVARLAYLKKRVAELEELLGT